MITFTGCQKAPSKTSANTRVRFARVISTERGAPHLRIRGEWMEALGLRPGVCVDLVVRNGQITIVPQL
jgi:hypothetical protein